VCGGDRRSGDCLRFDNGEAVGRSVAEHLAERDFVGRVVTDPIVAGSDADTNVNADANPRDHPRRPGRRGEQRRRLRPLRIAQLSAS